MSAPWELEWAEDPAFVWVAAGQLLLALGVREETVRRDASRGDGRSRAVGVTEDVVEADPEDASDLEGNLERGRILALLDGVHGLPGDAEGVGELALGHVVVRLAESADAVLHLGRLHHEGTPKRCIAMRAADDSSPDSRNAR